MGFLSAVLPGVRDLRTPLVVGALWTAIGIVSAWHFYDGATAEVGFVEDVGALVGKFPDTVKLAALAFCVYILGLMVKGMQEWIYESSLRNRILLKLDLDELPSLLRRTHLKPESGAKDYLADAARERFADYPPAVRRAAHGILMREYDLADVILTSRSPEQYQEYDRSRSEADFRNGVWVPLFLLSLGIGWFAGGPAKILIPVAGGVIAAMLKLQGIDRRRMADQRLASAVYFNLASTPLFDALLNDLSHRTEAYEVEKKRKPPEVTHIAWAVDFVAHRRLDDQTLTLLESQAHRMKAVLEDTTIQTKNRLAESELLGTFLLVGYGGVEWDAETRKLKENISVQRVLRARARTDEHLTRLMNIGDIPGGGQQIADAGALSFIADTDIPQLRREATDQEWKIAVHMIDSEASRYASHPSLATDPLDWP